MFGFFKRNRKKHRDAANAEKEQSQVQAPDIAEEASDPAHDASAVSETDHAQADLEVANVERAEAEKESDAEPAVNVDKETEPARDVKAEHKKAEESVQIARADESLTPVDIAAASDESLTAAEIAREMSAVERTPEAEEQEDRRAVQARVEFPADAKEELRSEASFEHEEAPAFPLPSQEPKASTAEPETVTFDTSTVLRSKN